MNCSPRRKNHPSYAYRIKEWRMPEG